MLIAIVGCSKQVERLVVTIDVRRSGCHKLQLAEDALEPASHFHVPAYNRTCGSQPLARSGPG